MIGSPAGGLSGISGISIHVEGHERVEYTRHYTTGSGKNRRHRTMRHRMHKQTFALD